MYPALQNLNTKTLHPIGTEPSFLVGRNPLANLPVTDTSCSRTQFRIVRTPSGYVVEGAVNDGRDDVRRGACERAVVLRDGAVIQAGGQSFRFLLTAPSQAGGSSVNTATKTWNPPPGTPANPMPLPPRLRRLLPPCGGRRRGRPQRRPRPGAAITAKRRSWAVPAKPPARSARPSRSPWSAPSTSAATPARPCRSSIPRSRAGTPSSPPSPAAPNFATSAAPTARS